ncbi:MAG: DUF362 domain-containing protein [Candidatus Marinimicrobia bacterium]|nr:DUF362 domain-containing protein [Candidatus Neomarinimicrobiota bacterium]
MTKQKIIKILVILGILSILLYLDISQARNNKIQQYPQYKTWSSTIDYPATDVALVRSNNSNLANPKATSADLSYSDVEDLVRKAVELAGGFEDRILSGDMVLIKPNIVDPDPSGCGEITDVRVVKALIKIIDEIDPGNIEIVVGEGSPRPMDYEMEYQSKFYSPQWDKLWDEAGYQSLKTDSYLEGINLRFSNLNGSPPENPWQDLRKVDLSNEYQALPQNGEYIIHKDVLNTDFYISVPVMKIHSVGMTNVLKNQVGIAPSTRYGFSKSYGVPQDNYTHNLRHGNWIAKEIVDLSNIADIDFAVVDAIACLEKDKSASWIGDDNINNISTIRNRIKMNTIIAGQDPVAVEHVSARLMGLNPDDFEQITLAEKVGLGTNDPEKINIKGTELENEIYPFKKSSSAAADYGQSNRSWLLKGPYSIDEIDNPLNHAFIDEEASTPKPGANGWSEETYFIQDRIDIGDYFKEEMETADVISYAFSYFYSPKNQKAELWVGSDDDLKIYINGKVVYSFSGHRNFGSYYNDIENNVDIKEGENTLLVKSLQKYSNYEFSLNICEPEDNPYYDGNRVQGLKFYTTSTSSVESELAHQSNEYQLLKAYPNPFNPRTTISYNLEKTSRVKLDVYNLQGQHVANLVNTSQRKGKHTFIWNTNNVSGQDIPTGIYFVRLKTNELSKTIKIVYQK